MSVESAKLKVYRTRTIYDVFDVSLYSTVRFFIRLHFPEKFNPKLPSLHSIQFHFLPLRIRRSHRQRHIPSSFDSGCAELSPVTPLNTIHGVRCLNSLECLSITHKLFSNSSRLNLRIPPQPLLHPAIYLQHYTHMSTAKGIARRRLLLPMHRRHR